MNITLKTPNLTFYKENFVYVIDFGTIPRNGVAKADINVNATVIKDFTVSTSCTCTSSTPNILDVDNIELSVGYKNTHKVSPFSVKIFLNFKENGEQKSETIKIKGNVV